MTIVWFYEKFSLCFMVKFISVFNIIIDGFVHNIRKPSLQIGITGRLKSCCDNASWLINYGRGEFYSITCFLIFGLLVQFLKWILLIQFDTKTKFKHEWTIKNEQSNTILSHKNRKKGQVRRKGHKGYHLLFPAMEYRHSWQTVKKFNFVSIVNFPFLSTCSYIFLYTRTYTLCN